MINIPLHETVAWLRRTFVIVLWMHPLNYRMKTWVLVETCQFSKPAIAHACMENYARFEFGILINVPEPNSVDILGRRQYVVSKLKAVFEIIHSSDP